MDIHRTSKLTVLLLMLFLFVSASSVSAQSKFPAPVLPEKDFTIEEVCEVSDLIPEEVVVKGPSQGFAICGNYAFSFHDKGQVVVLDLKNVKYVSTFFFPESKAHCNSVNFGKMKASRKDQFPLAYVSECGGRNRCFVTRLTLGGAEILQTIRYVGADAGFIFDWSVDSKGKYIYTYGGKHMGPKTLRKYALPSLADSNNEGEVLLTEKDLLDEIVIDDILIAQGNKSRGRYGYFTDGASPLNRVLHKVDYKKKEITASYILNDWSFEPEDIDLHKGWIYLQDFTGKTARGTKIFRIKQK